MTPRGEFYLNTSKQAATADAFKRYRRACLFVRVLSCSKSLKESRSVGKERQTGGKAILEMELDASSLIPLQQHHREREKGGRGGEQMSLSAPQLA